MLLHSMVFINTFSILRELININKFLNMYNIFLIYQFEYFLHKYFNLYIF